VWRACQLASLLAAPTVGLCHSGRPRAVEALVLVCLPALAWEASQGGLTAWTRSVSVPAMPSVSSDAARSKSRKGASAPRRGSALFSSFRRAELWLVVLGLLGVYTAMAVYSFHPLDPNWFNSGRGEAVRNLGGTAGANLADALIQLLGVSAWIVPVLFLYWTWGLARQAFWQRRFAWWRPVAMALLLATSSTMAAQFWPAASWPFPSQSAGGLLGGAILTLLLPRIGVGGLLLAELVLLGLAISLTFAVSPRGLRSAFGRWTLPSLPRPRLRLPSLRLPSWRGAQRGAPSAVASVSQAASGAPAPPVPTPSSPPTESVSPAAALRRRSRHPAPARPSKIEERQLPLSMTALDERGLPVLALLDPADPLDPAAAGKPEELAARSRLLEEKMADFGVQASVVAAHPGPVITRFEIEPAAGVKVSQVAGLSKDLARVLAARVRVVEAIPGKATMGIEVPNPKRRIVRLTEILSSPAFTQSKSLLTLALGQDIGGQPVAADLARMPHLLVAGTTGAGKSVGVNAMILSLLFKATPAEVRLILVDPKMLELSVYEGIPHLLAPVVTDMKEAANALRWCVAEMERRYQLMAHIGVRNLSGYNQKLRDAESRGERLTGPDRGADGEPLPLAPLPAIVVVIDEFADLMMVVGKQVETLITRLAQKARAAGLHLIMATQRPSVDVITGLIKANIPTRIAFQVSSRIDSRTILDQMGAETLLGQGDMLYLPPGTGYPQRVHGAYVSDEEVHRVVEALRSLGAPDYDPEILAGQGEDGEGGGMDDADAETDPLYDQAVAIVTRSRKASISYVQRQLKVGYNRAARMVEAMERAGVVGPLQSNGSREIYGGPPPGRDED